MIKLPGGLDRSKVSLVKNFKKELSLKYMSQMLWALNELLAKKKICFLKFDIFIVRSQPTETASKPTSTCCHKTSGQCGQVGWTMTLTQKTG